MRGRRREQILIIAGLIGLNILLGWFLGRLWKDYRNRTEWLEASSSAQPPASPAARSNQAGQPQSFVEIVDKNLFSPLRGTPPPPPPEEAKPPRVPFLSGTMNLGNGWFALMAPGDQPLPVYKRVRPGEEIGGYKLVSIGASNVVLEWQEKKITLDISEAARRAPGAAERAAGAGLRAGAVAAVGGAGAAALRVAPPATAGPHPATAQLVQAAAAPQVGVGQIAPGTVVGGKRAVVVPTPFGPMTQLEDAGPPGSQAPPQSGGPNK